ncbi:hypothetical protein Q757_06540 [Oenococcus alcoholitolerans]|uniref:Thiolase N-terminal domain-containing protein n=1 Tax=Oenococcus alcoholitolerans TaxID=931074 RepID=A0ABR4XQ09_9LACO|nr:hypothetical protein Q757_06540 [Oenococcus alcoholitolerans]
MRKTASAGQAVIVAGSRTPFGNYQGLLSSYSAVDLAVEAGKSLLKIIIFLLKWFPNLS